MSRGMFEQLLNKKRRWGGVLVALFALILLVVPSCEIGLGSSIDTERPQMQITYPPKGAIIMGTFTLAGTVSDDMGVSYMNVTLTHKTLKTQFSYSSKDGEVIVELPAKSWADGTTWSAKIGKQEDGKTLYNGWDLPDGEYFVDVEVSDGIGSVYDRRSITIDNTPPAFIMENENPEGHINDRYYLFGQRINLSGKAKDESDLSKVFFTAYDIEANEILSSKLDYEMTYDGILLAQYSETPPTDPQKRILADNFNTIYGISYGAQSLKEVKECYITVQISDNARIYDEPVYENLSEEETANLGRGDGNLTTEIYLDPQGKTTLSLEGITIDEICSYKTHLTENKTFEDKLNSMESTSIAAATVDSDTDFSKVLKLQINPDIFPKWYIANYGKKEGEDYRDAFLGSPLTVQFEKGNNNEAFRPSNIRIVLARLDEIKNPDGTKSFKLCASTEKLENATTSDEDVIVLRNYGDMSQDLTRNLAEQIDITKLNASGEELLHTASSYEVLVFGHDGSGESGYKFHPKEDGGYGMHLVKNLQPPRIFFLCNEDAYKSHDLPKEDSWIGPNVSLIPFWFKVRTDGEELSELPEINVQLNDLLVVSEGYYELIKDAKLENVTPVEEDKKKEYTFKWELKRTDKPLPTTSGWNNEFNFTISITAKDNGGTQITQTFTLQFDNKKPELTVGTPSPIVVAGGKNCLNGIVTIPVEYSDNYKVKGNASYIITGKDSSGEDKTVEGTVANKSSISLNTTEFKDKENVTIKVSVTDGCDNITEIIPRTYYVDQDTDTPKFTFTGLNEGNGWNNYGIKINNMIQGSVSDDDGIGELKVRARKQKSDGTWDDGDWSEWKEITVSNVKESDEWKAQIAYNFVLGELITANTGDGKYQIQFTVTDTKSETGKHTKTSPIYNLLIDGTDPVFGDVTVKQDSSDTDAIKSGSTYYAKKEQSLIITVPLTEANLKDVTVNGSATNVTPTSTVPTHTVTYTWTPDTETTGNKTVIFLATDLAGNTKEKEVSIYYDADTPKVEEFTVTPVLTENKVNGKISIKGMVSDDDKIKVVEVVIKDKNGVEKKRKSIEAQSFNMNDIDTIELEDGNLTFEISMTDRAGNTSLQIYTYTIDQESDRPIIIFDENQIDTTLGSHDAIENATDDKNMFGITSDKVISGNVSDDDGVGKVTVIAKNADGTTQVGSTKEYTPPQGSKAFEFNCDIVSDLGITDGGNYVIEVTAEDTKKETTKGTENYYTKTLTVPIVVDGTAPVISDVKIGTDSYDTDKKRAYINGQKTITFKVNEMHLDAVTWKVGSGDATPATVTSSSTSGEYECSFDYKPSSTAVVIITATDKTELSTSMELNITYDNKPPVINAPAVEPLCTFTSSDGRTRSNVVNGTINISGNITDNDKVLDKDITVELQRKDGSTWSDIKSVTAENQRYNFAYDTTELVANGTDYFEGEIKLSVTATDRAGNTKTEYFTYYVDQNSDTPVITFTNVNAEATNAKDNLFGMGTWIIRGSVKDDDGLTGLKLYATEGDKTYEDKEAATTGDFTIDNSGGFKYTIPQTKDSVNRTGDKVVTLKVVDSNGETGGRTIGTKTISINYAIDRHPPQFVSQKINGTSYAEDMFVNKDVDIEFEVSDDNGVATLEYKTGTNSYEEITKDSANEKYIHKLSEADGEKTKTYRLTDKYGRQSEISLKYNIDKTKPVVKPLTDFAVENIPVDTDGTLKQNDVEKWFNSSALTVSAKAGAVTDKNLTTTVSYEVGGSSGTFQISLKNGNASEAFNDTRSFTEGESTLKYTFSDKAGNSSDTGLIKIKVDTIAPTITLPATPITGVTDGVATGNITATITASDANGSLAVSGLDTAVFGKKANFGTDEQYGDSIKFSGNSVSKEIAISDLADGLHEVWVRVTDKAGNITADVKVGEFTVDKTNPTVTINPVSDADTSAEGIQVNKTITISGVASDSNPTENVPVLSIYAADASGNKTGSAITTTGLITQNSSTFASWSYNVDTTKLINTTGSKKYVFEVVATDKAGNPGSSSLTLDVNQNTDRPIVTLHKVNTSGTTTLSDGVIEWEVADDDGKPKKVEVQVTEKVASAPTDETSATATVGKWVEVTADTNGKYSFTVPNDTTTGKPDGNYKLWFRVTDDADVIFTSSDSDATNADLTKPRVVTRDVNTITGGGITFDVDSESPEITSVKIFIKVNGAYETPEEGKDYELSNSSYFGGTLKKEAKIVIDAKDKVVTDPDSLTYKLKLNGEYVKDSSGSIITNITKEYEIDFSKCADGTLQMVFEVYDNAGIPGTKTVTVFVDNLKPDTDGKAVTNMIPSRSTEVTGTVSVTANMSDDSTARSGIDSTSVAYYIPKKNGTVEETEPEEIAESKWKYAKDDESFNVTDMLMAFDITGLSSNAEIVDEYSGYQDGSTGIYNIPVWIKLSDKVGNTSYVTTNTIRYNPDAARPRVAVTYPVHIILSTDDGNESGKDYVVLGGNIRIAGSAQDNVGIKEVYVQYDINGDGKYDKKDYNWFVGKTAYELVKPIPGRTDETLYDGTSSDCWGIKAKGTMSWNTTLDTTTGITENLEIGINGNINKTLNIRVCAVDTDHDVDPTTDQHVSAWSDEIHVSLNNSMPSYGKFSLVQYEDSTYAKEIGRTDYKEGMYIRTTGRHWRLEGYVGDNDGIGKVVVTGSQTGDLDTEGWFDPFTKTSNSEINLNGYFIHIPVVVSSGNRFTLNIDPEDTSNPASTNPSSYIINIDNVAPEFKDGANIDTLALFQGDYATKSGITETTKLQNSNGWTTIASKASDSGSGFAKAIFYVKRTGSGSKDRVYNIMEAHGNNRTANRTDLVASEKTNSVYINGDGLPVLKVTAKNTDGKRPDEDKIEVELDGIGSNANIRAGGVVLIGGFYRTIAAVTKDSANKITVTLAEGVDVKYTDAYFVYGMVVNNSGESRDRNGNLKGDDGDEMVESVKKTNSDYVWDATFDSTHIPDGPVEIHVVVFDNAENMRHGSVSARISNNSPRLARVTLGTDLNGDGNIGDDECTTYNANSKYEDYSTDKLAYEITGSARNDFNQVWNLDSATVKLGNNGDDWKIKNKLRVKPEFVGGTAPFYYVFSKAAGTGKDKWLTEETKKSGKNLPNATGNSGTQGTFANHGGYLELINDTIGTDYENQVNTYQFTFWDSTEESTVGTNTDWTVLNVELYQDIVDTERPKPIIHPFFWKAKGSVAKGEAPNNSIQWDDKGAALGHIELEQDLPTATFTSSGTGVYDLDPKVSGKIVLRGTAYDETRLTEVNIKASETSILGTTGITATYTPSSKEWSTGTVTGATLTINDMGYTQKGHLVEWTLEVDTQNLTGKVKNDVTFTVQAKDGVASSTGVNKPAGITDNQTKFNTTPIYATETQATLKQFYTDKGTTTLAEDSINYEQSPLQFNLAEGSEEVYEYRYGTTNTYKMDIVPYVTKVTTKLSAKDGNTPGKYSRTSLGHYAVQSVVSNASKMSNKTSETITLSGFNLGGTVAVTGIADDEVTEEKGTIKFSAADLKSCELTVTVGGIPLMNNINNNDAQGDATATGSNYANWYNRMANGDNNNNLNDDIWFDVWEFNDRVAKAAAGGYMYGLNMQIGKGQSLVQYAYVSSNKEIYFAQKASGTNYSSIYSRHKSRGQQDYLVPSSVGFGVKDDGTTYATVLGGEDTDDYELLVGSVTGNGSVAHYNIDTVSGVNHALKDQIYSPSFAFGKNDYLAYYDKYNQQIRFLAGGQLTGKTLDVTNETAENVTRDPSKTDNTACQVIAGGSKEEGSKASKGAGEYVSLAVIKGTGTGNNDTKDVVCIVWYDLAANTLWYNYKTDPTDKTGTTAAGWSSPKPIFSNGGEYCKIAIDGNNGIHIAAYVGGEVHYAYASSYSSDFKKCVVDVNDAGKNLTLDVSLNNATDKIPLPVIGYYSGAQMPKYAKLAADSWIGSGNTREPPDGADANKRYTGSWDVSFVPVRNNLILDRVEKVNVGVWKDASGISTNSTATASTYTNTATNNCSSQTYGNGTNNAILLYLTESGENMESAQMRGSN